MAGIDTGILNGPGESSRNIWKRRNEWNIGEYGTLRVAAEQQVAATAAQM